MISCLETVVIDSFSLSFSFLFHSQERERGRVWRRDRERERERKSMKERKREIEEVSSLNFWRFFNCDPLGVLSFQKKETKILERERERKKERKEKEKKEATQWIWNTRMSWWVNELSNNTIHGLILILTISSSLKLFQTLSSLSSSLFFFPWIFYVNWQECDSTPNEVKNIAVGLLCMKNSTHLISIPFPSFPSFPIYFPYKLYFPHEFCIHPILLPAPYAVHPISCFSLSIPFYSFSHSYFFLSFLSLFPLHSFDACINWKTWVLAVSNLYASCIFEYSNHK